MIVNDDDDDSDNDEVEREREMNGDDDTTSVKHNGMNDTTCVRCKEQGQLGVVFYLICPSRSCRHHCYLLPFSKQAKTLNCAIAVFRSTHCFVVSK